MPAGVARSVKRVATGLDSTGIEARCGPDFPHTSRQTPAVSCKLSTESLSQGGGVKRLGSGVGQPSSAEIKESVELYFYSPSEPSWPVLGLKLPFAYL